ncbi:DUF2586 family protein [Chryseosolibacter indicus]|uniref:DUF2586 family protein n=1 Tax=Chryseosolibacter indicus TaxID=2782351 RepID=A0ABS5VNC7_9BACT|nr:DUF2586 family protein [Chryseosolibacter indicus]MBT1702957.1 hypothetical protein [Chryseosolibacter indicus]
MANTPKVTLIYENGNLLQDIAAADGIVAICGTGASVGLLGTPMVVYNLDDAIEKGFTLAAEPEMYRHLQEFYSEVGGNQELHVMVVPDTMTLAQMVDNTNASGAKKLINAAQGKVRMLGIYRKPASGYNGGSNFIDSDVSAAITNSKVFAEARLSELVPLRILVEGRVQTPAAANTLTPNTLSNGYAGVVLGGSRNDGSASVGLVLGRASRYGAHIKIGKVANGPLTINQVYLGDKLLKDVANLDTLHGNGFITFMTHPQKAGFFFGIDRMCSTDDYRLLAYGRVVDKAAVIAAAVYTEQIESEIEVDGTGKIATHVVSDLETVIEQQINVAMGSQISGVKVVINPDQNIINTNKLTIKIRVQPLGYSSFIDVELGLTTAIA